MFPFYASRESDSDQKMITLKEAQKDPKSMQQFIAEHEGDEIEDKDFEKVIKSMSDQGKPKEVPATSSKDASGDCT